MAMDAPRVVVVGAGPAGVRAAEALVKDEEKVTARLLRGAAATLKPQPGQRDWGAGRTVLPRLRAQIMTEAALVGWSSPRVQGHLRRLAAVQEKWDRLAAASVEKTLVLLPAKGTELALKADEISVKVTTFSCEGGERCLLQLMARNNGAKAKTCSSVTSWLGGVRKAALVRADGKMVELKIQECRVKGRGKVSRVQPGEEATVKLGIGRRGLAKGPRPERIKMLWLSDFLARKVDLLRL